jgi:hypothetical protein
MKVLIIPNYTNFGMAKDINRDSFLLVFKSFLDNTEIGKTWEWILPYPDLNNHPGIINQFEYPNVQLIKMDGIDCFPPKMRVDYPHKFFDRLIEKHQSRFNLIWSHLPEWTNAYCVSRIYNAHQPIIGYCHWSEIPENGARTDNSFWTNLRGILQMKVCGVNSNYQKSVILKNAALDFKPDVVEKLDKIIQPWYLGCDTATPSNGYDDKTIVFNHREGGYTGSNWFWESMDDLWKERQDFKVYTTLKEKGKPYTKYIGAADRKVYLNQLSKAHFGVGTFQGYSAWSMSTTDGFSVGVPYLLPNDFCYPEMVGDDYPLLYNGKKEFKEMVIKLLDGDIPRPDVTNLAQSLLWESQIKEHWNVEKNFIGNLRTEFKEI